MSIFKKKRWGCQRYACTSLCRGRCVHVWLRMCVCEHTSSGCSLVYKAFTWSFITCFGEGDVWSKVGQVREFSWTANYLEHILRFIVEEHNLRTDWRLKSLGFKTNSKNFWSRHGWKALLLYNPHAGTFLKLIPNHRISTVLHVCLPTSGKIIVITLLSLLKCTTNISILPPSDSFYFLMSTFRTFSLMHICTNIK